MFYGVIITSHSVCVFCFNSFNHSMWRNMGIIMKDNRCLTTSLRNRRINKSFSARGSNKYINSNVPSCNCEKNSWNWGTFCKNTNGKSLFWTTKVPVTLHTVLSHSARAISDFLQLSKYSLSAFDTWSSNCFVFFSNCNERQRSKAPIKYSKFYKQRRKDLGAECRYDMPLSVQLPSFSGTDSKLGLTMV